MSKRLSMFDAMIAKGTQDPFVHYGRAMELRGLGRSDEALAAFEALRAQFPAYVPTYLMGGQLAVELGRVEIARDFFEHGLRAARSAGDEHAASEIASALGTLPAPPG